MHRIFASLILFCALSLCALQPAAAVTIAWTPVGNPGNAPDPATGSLYGAVGYSYNIAKNDVTYSQYVEFLNLKDPTGANTLNLYSGVGVGMGDPAFGGINFTAGNADGSKYSVMPGDDNRPLAFPTFYDIVRFANWMNNGQGNADTEAGAYTLLHDGSPTPTATPSNAGSIMRSAGAVVFIPTENEWYKAAFYNPATGTYFQYATNSIIAPTAAGPPGGPNSANYNNAVGHVTDVGAYTLSPSPYGTFDQAGNILQWTETPIDDTERVLRGSSYDSDSSGLLSSNRFGFPEDGERLNGFRLASTPEPSSLILAAFGFVGFVVWGWRRRKQ